MAKKKRRDEELSKDEKLHEKLVKLYTDVAKAFMDQRNRSNAILDYWDLYNCRLGEKQFYNGTSQIFVPIVHDAIAARRTRFVNQIFPKSNRYVEAVIFNEDDEPHRTIALAEHYIDKCKLRTEVIPSMCVAGDVEGQYSLYVGWGSRTRHVVSRISKPITVRGFEFADLGETQTLKKEKIVDEGPLIEVLSDIDLVVHPATVDSIEEAMEIDGYVAIQRRWTKGRIDELVDEGDFIEDVAKSLKDVMTSVEREGVTSDVKKKLAEDAGIKVSQAGVYAIGYEVWKKFEIDGVKRICRAYLAGGDKVLGCKLNPYWCDKVPVLSAPVEKEPGVFKGISQCQSVCDLQVLANDTVNEGADTAHFSAMPIIMTDPEKNPRLGSMVLAVAAVWQTNPNDTKFAQLPEIWKSSLDMVNQIKMQIFQSLGVNPAMLPQQTGVKNKRNQAEIANEQQVDLLSTADAVTTIEGGILTPLVQRIIEYDMQFRDDDILVKMMGEFGQKAKMEVIEPIQANERYWLQWFGVEQARSAQMIQQQISTLGMLTKIPPQALNGKKINLVPAISQIISNTFGSRLAPVTFVDLKDELSVDPEVENRMLEQGFNMTVHAMDDDPKHLQAHQQAMQMSGGDPKGVFRVHIQKHMQQMQMKQQAQAMAQAQGQAPGGGGGQRPGSQAGPPKQAGPPGAIHPDQMAAAGAATMPRKT